MSEENKREEQAAAMPPEGEAAKPADGTAEPQATPAAEAPKESPAAEGQSSADKPAEAAASDVAATAKPADAGAAAAGSGEAAPPRRKETDEEKAARRKAAFEARQAAKAAAAQAKADAERAASAAATAGAAASGDAPAEGASEADAPPPPPSPNQPRLNRAVELLREHVGADAVEEAYINEANDHLPTIVMKDEHWAKAALLFRDHDELGCVYLRNVSGIDYESYMEVVYYPLNMQRRETYCIKVRTDREQPSIPSVTHVWETANWHEREIFDLLGIDFPGHPNMTRIMMPDDWVGHPLRKDYVPLDPEV